MPCKTFSGKDGLHFTETFTIEKKSNNPWTSFQPARQDSTTVFGKRAVGFPNGLAFYFECGGVEGGGGGGGSLDLLFRIVGGDSILVCFLTRGHFTQCRCQSITGGNGAMALCPVGWVECRGIEWNGSLDVSQQGKDLFRAWVVGVAVESVCVCVCVHH